jgi:phosphoribosylformylglycinamidine synthase
VKDAKKFAAGFALVQSLLLEDGTLLAGHDVSSGGTICAALEMAFAGNVGIELTLPTQINETISFAFSEKPALILQIAAEHFPRVQKECEAHGLATRLLAEIRGTMIRVNAGELSFTKGLSELRRTWYRPSFLLDAKQTREKCAKERFESFDKHPLKYKFPSGFTGTLSSLPVEPDGKTRAGLSAAIVRDKGTNGDRELAYSLFLCGFDVKDITMTDLVSGREDLSDVSLLAFPGGFSNSDVLGSARGWAGAFRYNPKADEALSKFYDRPDTLSIGVCNGCQLMMELGLVFRGDKTHPRMKHNESGKFESAFVGVRVPETKSIMMKPLIGSDLGVWVAHGEGRFEFSKDESSYDIALKFMSADYPANPNGSQFNAAAVCSSDGRHLAIMPHIERSLFAWNWPHRADFSPQAELSPWVLSFLAAKDWLLSR